MFTDLMLYMNKLDVSLLSLFPLIMKH